MNPMNYNLDQVGTAFDNWRANRSDKNSAIPEALWELVGNIYSHYSRGRICARLGLSSGQLKRRGYDVPGSDDDHAQSSSTEGAQFIDVAQPVLSSSTVVPPAEPAPSIEIERPDGTRIRLHALPEAHLSLFFNQLIGD